MYRLTKVKTENNIDTEIENDKTKIKTNACCDNQIIVKWMQN